MKAHPNVEVMLCRETRLTIPLDLGAEMLGKTANTHNTYTQSWLGNFQEFIQKPELQHVSIWEWYCIAAERPLWKDVPWVQGSVATRNHALWKQNGAEYVFYDQGPASWHRETDESYPCLLYTSAGGGCGRGIAVGHIVPCPLTVVFNVDTVAEATEEVS